MYKFNNAAYESVVRDLISDAFYLNGRSLRGKISTIRQYAEIVVKRILNFPVDEHFTLGQKNVKSKLKDKEDQRLLEAVAIINDLGSKNTHTEFIGSPIYSELSTALDALFYLYSFMLIEFFEEYKFGEQLKIISAFSTLPPIIRYITLDSLNCKDPNNIVVIDKLVLATIKAFDEIRAFKWVEERKEILQITSSLVESAIPAIVEKFGQTTAEVIIANAPNMYLLCNDKINKISDLIEKRGHPYTDFEDSIDYYKSFGVVEGDSLEIKKFNSILEFLYLGRKHKDI